jgi:hypothetical protein
VYEGDEEEVDILQQALMVSGQQIQLIEQRESLLQAQLGTARANIRSVLVLLDKKDN